MAANGPGTPVYPLSLRMEGRLAVVVGGGAVAVRRVAGLRAAGADVLVVAPDLSPSLADLAARGLIAVRQASYQATDLEGAWLALACTDQPEVNAAVAADAERLRLWCVRADDAGAATAWVPAVGRTGQVTIAVNADRDPRGAASLRDACVQAVAAHPAGPAGKPGPGGRVSIVGAGPGDPGLITVAGLERLRAADVVVTDRLVASELLACLPDDVLVIDAAKVPGGPAARQGDINAALVRYARAGRAVVRLKGGDPFVFGRGREEVDACRDAGVPVEVVPGVTSAVAVPAAAGIPVTHRGLSQGFTVVSGHVSPADPRSTVDWAALARSGTTLVLLMAVDQLPAIAATLMAAGLPAGTPTACVADGWTGRQQAVTAPLAGLPQAMAAEGVSSPAVIVIGEVAGYAPESRPGPRPAPAPGRPARAASRVLVLGGARSGKSTTAENFLAACGPIEYVATGALPGAGDPEWAARVSEHRRRRPPHWRTTETLDLEQVLRSADPVPVLVDCLSVWLARVMDECGAWGGSTESTAELRARIDRLLCSWRDSSRQVVAVSNEVGCGIVPDTVSGRRFRDELGRLNALIAAGSDEVWLCTAGVPRRLK
jgi:uroporphyrin-III C-methyltransferase/precorrin-2 dehydrogenase/sirohydrochlorin ferrochelatase